MLIKSTNLSDARLMDFVQVITLTAGYLAKENLESLQLKAVASEFNLSLTALEAAVTQAQKTGYTEAIIAADDQRDNIYTGFSGALRSAARFPDASVAQSAAQLLLITDKYGQGITRLPQREESAILSSIVAELRTPANGAHLQKTGLTLWVDKLDEANKAFDGLYVNRTEKEAEFITGLTRTQRAASQAAFEQLARAIEAYAYINGEAAYKALADKINTEVEKVQQAIKSRSTGNQNKQAAAPAK